MSSCNFTNFLLLVASLALLLRLGASVCSNRVVIHSVNESSAAGTVIEALDSSYSGSFTTKPSDYKCFFKISGNALRLTRELDLENLTSCSGSSRIPLSSVESAVTIEVPCTASETENFVVSLVDINEFAPKFSPSHFTVSISEAVPVGTIVIQLNGNVSDADKSNQNTFNFEIVSGSQGYFSIIDGITSGIVRVQRQLDYDAGQRRFVMNVSASELATASASKPQPLTGYATIEILVTDSDDKNPQFTQQQYSFKFPENESSFLNRWMSTDPPIMARDSDIGINQSVTYFLEFGTWAGKLDSLQYNISFITVNSTTGQLSVTELLDREALPSDQILLQIRAQQTDKPDTRVARASVLVTISDKNDNSPIMGATVYNAAITENLPAGSFVAMVTAADSDKGVNSSIIFRMNDTSGALQIDAATGLVTVRDPARLDRETTSVINASVWAQENMTADSFSSLASLLTVQLIDVNDNSPSAPAALNFNVSGEAAAGTKIGSVAASDPDAGAAGSVRFSVIFASSGAAELFQIGADNGSIVTKVPLAGKTPNTHYLGIGVDDGAAEADRRRTVTIVQITIVSKDSVTTDFLLSSSTSSSTIAVTSSHKTLTTTKPLSSSTFTTASTSTIQSIATTSKSTSKSTPSLLPVSSFSTPSSVHEVWNTTFTVPKLTRLNATHVRVEITSTIISGSGLSTVSTQATVSQLGQSQTTPVWLLVVCALLAAATAALCLTVAVLTRTQCSKSKSKAEGDEKSKETQNADTTLYLSGKANPIFADGEPADRPSPTSHRSGISSDGYSPQTDRLSKVMFEPAPYQSLTFSLLVPDTGLDEEVTDDSPTVTGLHSVSRSAAAETATPF